MSPMSKKSKKMLMMRQAIQEKQKRGHTSSPASPQAQPPASPPAQPPASPPASRCEDSVASSASKTKLHAFECQHNLGLSASSIMQVDALQTLFKKFSCPECKEGHFVLRSDDKKRSGLGLFLEVICNVCDFVITSSYTSVVCTGKIFDVNKRAVAASLVTGLGYAGMGKFFEIINVPNIHQKTFDQHATTLHQSLPTYKDKLLELAVDKVKAAYPEQNQVGVVDIDVSYDGSWHTRGHSSKSGIGCVIENRTGLVVDFECLSKFCQRCSTTGQKMQEESKEKFTSWMASHKISCDINHTGSSGSMEQQAAVAMWGRSVSKHVLRYRTVVSVFHGP